MERILKKGNFGREVECIKKMKCIELKNLVSLIKNLIDVFKSIVDKIEETISELENKRKEIFRMKKRVIKFIGDKIKRINILMIGELEEEEEE